MLLQMEVHLKYHHQLRVLTSNNNNSILQNITNNIINTTIPKQEQILMPTINSSTSNLKSNSQCLPQLQMDMREKFLRKNNNPDSEREDN